MADMIAPIKTIVYDRIFKQEIHVFCNSTEKELLAWQKKIGVSDNDNEGLNPNFSAFSTHYYSEEEPNIYLIWINNFDWTLNDQDSLIHEVVHTIVRIWKANNIKFVPETQEFFAHSVGHLYADIGAKIMVRKKKK
jgi:protein involved in sex pheromone biosynthesis